MMGIYHTIRVALTLSSLLVGGRLLADDGGREVAVEINKANGLLRSGDIDAAVKAYSQVQGVAPDRADVSYNMAVAQYRKGDMVAAEQLFKQSSTAENDALAAKARYNLGNCNYASALRQAETDRSAAIKELSNAIANYRGALEIDLNDADSRANIELAAAMIEKLREQEKKQQQQESQNQQQQKQEPNPQQQKDGDKEEQLRENSKSSDDQQQKDSQQESGKDQQNDQQQSQQKDEQQKSSDAGKDQSSNKNESQSKEQTPQDSKTGQQDSKSQPSGSESQSHGQKNSTAAEENQQPQSQNESQPAPDESSAKSEADKRPEQSEQQKLQSATQKKPTNKGPDQDIAQQSEQQKVQQGSAAPKGSLTAADEKAGKTDQQGKKAVAMPEIAPDGAMTTQEAEKMLQAIRDQEMLRRMRRQAAERIQHIPVDRDW